MRCREGSPSPMMENPSDFFLSRHRLAPVFFTALEASLATHPPVSFGSSSYIEATLSVSGLDFPLPGITHQTADFII